MVKAAGKTLGGPIRKEKDAVALTLATYLQEIVVDLLSHLPGRETSSLLF